MLKTHPHNGSAIFHNMPSTEGHYSSGSYWENRLGQSSDFKVSLALRALSGANVPIKHDVKALEIGCGDGAFLFPLAKTLESENRAFHLYGYDIAVNAIEHARRTAIQSGEN